MMRALLATIFLVLFSVSAFAAEPPVADRFGPGTQWYQPKHYGKHARHARHAKPVRYVKARRIPQTHERVARFVREKVAVLGGRPSGCPSAWCGCWLGRHLGMTDRSLWLARNWAHRGSPAGGPAPGVIAVWRHHVGKVVAVQGNRILLLSGNDGRAVRQRWRSAAGVIAWRRV